MLQAELPLAIVENKPDYKAVKQKAEDWDDVQVCSISEILVAVERKDKDDLPDVTLATKKLCPDAIKLENLN
ncbi:unnamed protein product [Eruca vesicaria subsp. sativa]|uniref:Uncharacterized protein n=1 Tax=Eruca vesicaria subsp. sativa TaxID=29727 RepID=A0ABC8M326_ERUVS|nr:unnamed protein product [Eruca vesicaria subsp. sativa]